ncbi:hypothetical protein D9M70_624030 [compost metagenome]
MQVVPGLLRHARQTRVLAIAGAPMQVAGQAFEQRVEGGLADDLQLTAMQAFKRQAGGLGQARITGQGGGETQLAVVGGMIEHGAEFAL